MKSLQKESTDQRLGLRSNPRDNCLCVGLLYLVIECDSAGLLLTARFTEDPKDAVGAIAVGNPN